ncbi:MAG: glycerol-3-phosphate 1-O-acyltransferase PlsY [Ruthenibacterium sp.]
MLLFMHAFFALLCAAIAYLLGSCSFAILVTKLLYHKDIRTFGSGNAGMTNVLRTFGKGAAALTIVGDIGKGIVAVLLSKWIFGAFTSINPVYGAYIAAFFAVIGHIYPLYFGFKGGKAVSVATGTIIAIEPILVLPLLAVFLLVFLCSKMVSLASICCAVLYPVVTWIYFNWMGHDVVFTTIGAAVIGGLVLWMHRSNIKRILAGTEYKFGQKKKQTDAPQNAASIDAAAAAPVKTTEKGTDK